MGGHYKYGKQIPTYSRLGRTGAQTPPTPWPTPLTAQISTTPTSKLKDKQDMTTTRSLQQISPPKWTSNQTRQLLTENQHNAYLAGQVLKTPPTPWPTPTTAQYPPPRQHNKQLPILL